MKKRVVTNSKISTFSDAEIIQMAIRQFSIKHLPGVVGVGRGFINNGGVREICLQINVNDQKYLEIYNKPLGIDLGNNKTVSVAPNVIVVGHPKIHAGEAGSGIINVGGENGVGTFGCVVMDHDTKKKHILSCQHVLNHDTDYSTVSNPDSIAFVNNSAEVIARHVLGERTHEIDAALAEIISDTNFDNLNLGKIKGTRNLGLNDTNETVKISLKGYDLTSSQIATSKGVIVNNEFYTEFSYADGNKFGMEDLIVLGNKNNDTYSTLSKPGYSGALVVDENMYAIGLLVGGDDNYSYAIPINKILVTFNCSIV